MGKRLNLAKIRASIAMLLEALGEDTEREGLVDTPDRVARMWEELFKERDVEIKTFTNPKYNEMICKTNISFFSFCEHHILPFYGTVDIAYIPRRKVIGISKLARIVRKFASRLNIQEQMTQDIVEFINKQLNPKGVMVIVRAKHLCEVMRGVRDCGTMITSAVRGIFADSKCKAREEFLNVVGKD